MDFSLICKICRCSALLIGFICIAETSFISNPGLSIRVSPCNGSSEAVEVIDLSDIEAKQEEGQTGENRIGGEDLKSLVWYYLDPQGQQQGPFSTSSLKRWSDAEYFPPDFKVWKMGESQERSVLLSNLLQQTYTA